MSAMSELWLDIQLLLEQGLTVEEVAAKLNVSVKWVNSVALAQDAEHDDCFDPYNTVNS